jgi:hypothetical protein
VESKSSECITHVIEGMITAIAMEMISGQPTKHRPGNVIPGLDPVLE